MRLALFLIFTASLFAQTVEVGAVGGVPLTHVFTADTLNPNGAFGLCGECGVQHTLPYVVGPAIQIHLWRPLYLDAQGLYSRADYTFISTSVTGSTGIIHAFSRSGVDRWEVPILLKIQLKPWRLVHPFAAAGVSFQHGQQFVFFPPGPHGEVDINTDSAIGATFAAGASFGSRWVRPSIEVRYTRWAEQPLVTAPTTVTAKRDEAQFLAGLMFAVKSDRPDASGILEGSPLGRRVSLGIKGGLLLTDALSARMSETSNLFVFGTCLECGTSRTLPYAVGPALEIRIAGGLSATAEVLYSHANYNHISTGKIASFAAVAEEKHAVGRWEAPLLLKYSLKMGGLTPFIAAGASVQYDRDSRVRRLQGLAEISPFPTLPQFQLSTASGPPADSLVVGPTASLGTSFNAGRRVHPSIEVRYTHWIDRAISVTPSPDPFAPLSTPPNPPTIFSTHNQIQLLVGIMF